MTTATAIELLLSVLVAIDLILTVGIVRRLRAVGGQLGPLRPPPTDPQVGHHVDLLRDPAAWPAEAASMTEGLVLAAFVYPDCSGCDRLHRQVDAFGELPVPFFLLGDPFANDRDEVLDYLGTWPQARPILVPSTFDTLVSFARPSVTPTMVLLHDGVVLATGNHLDDVAAPMQRMLDRSGVR